MMGRPAIVIGVTLILAGCTPDPYPSWATDKIYQAKLFDNCMQSLPAGPQKTKYNDWDEVVSECRKTSHYLSQYCYANCPEKVRSTPFTKNYFEATQ